MKLKRTPKFGRPAAASPVEVRSRRTAAMARSSQMREVAAAGHVAAAVTELFKLPRPGFIGFRSRSGKDLGYEASYDRTAPACR